MLALSDPSQPAIHCLHSLRVLWSTWEGLAGKIVSRHLAVHTPSLTVSHTHTQHTHTHTILTQYMDTLSAGSQCHLKVAPLSLQTNDEQENTSVHTSSVPERIVKVNIPLLCVCVCVCVDVVLFCQQSHSLPASLLQREAEERYRERRREREEGRTKRNSHHTLWDGGCEYQQTSST